MKFRCGFVSNSSSQAFVIRGVEIEKDVLARLLKVEDSKDVEWAIYEKVKRPLQAHSVRSFFDCDGDDKTTKIVIGYTLADPDDGVVTKLKEPDDDKVRELLRKLGITAVKLYTYMQFISNDNF
jgi:hypothetical protein